MKTGIINKIQRVFAPNGFYYLFYYLIRLTRVSDLLSDKLFTKIQYKANVGKRLNLDHPVTYNEKIQWLKLYDHRAEYSTLVDKYRVKPYIAQLIGEQYIIPTIGVWKTPEDIDFNSLPDQFVLKTNHAGGNTGVVICRDKALFNIENAKIKLMKSLRRNVYLVSREWPYKDIKRCIIAEPYMEDEMTGELRDYKFFCFNGVPKALFVASGRQDHEEPYFDFFDMDFNHLDLRCPHPQAKQTPQKPSCFDEMKRLASILSNGLPHVRVDLYEINGKPYFGELTLYHWEGLMPFYPESWNVTFGDWLVLPKL